MILLGQVSELEDKEDQLEIIQGGGSEAEAEIADLCRALFDKKKSWKDIQGMLKELDISNPEQCRYYVLAWCKNSLLGTNTSRQKMGYLLFVCFEESFMYTGSAGFVAACYAAKNKVE